MTIYNDKSMVLITDTGVFSVSYNYETPTILQYFAGDGDNATIFHSARESGNEGITEVRNIMRHIAQNIISDCNTILGEWEHDAIPDWLTIEISGTSVVATK